MGRREEGNSRKREQHEQWHKDRKQRTMSRKNQRNPGSSLVVQCKDLELSLKRLGSLLWGG